MKNFFLLYFLFLATPSSAFSEVRIAVEGTRESSAGAMPATAFDPGNGAKEMACLDESCFDDTPQGPSSWTSADTAGQLALKLACVDASQGQQSQPK